jgi:hypothetical protein
LTGKSVRTAIDRINDHVELDNLIKGVDGIYRPTNPHKDTSSDWIHK